MPGVPPNQSNMAGKNIILSQKAQSKTGFLTEKLNFKSRNEHGKVDFQEEDGTDGSPKEDGPYESCNKKDEGSLFYGTHETQELKGGEADLLELLVRCKKNEGHEQFVPVNDFNINHLPDGNHDNDLVEYIKATADLTVRVAVTTTSTKRQEFWPNTNQHYPFHDKRGSDITRLGTGMVTNVNKRYNKGTCPCHKCQHSETPSNVWGDVWMDTARHVVFDDLEAKHTTCRLFYDRKDSPLVTLQGWTVDQAEIEEDRCWLNCVTCDIDLLDKLEKMVDHWRNLWRKVNNVYKRSSDNGRLTFIISHPHGCPKQISIGQWINRLEVGEYQTKYMYTTCTCPGSSGAHVQSLGFGHHGLSLSHLPGYPCYYVNHVHSGVTSEQINFSGVGRDQHYY